MRAALLVTIMMLVAGPSLKANREWSSGLELNSIDIEVDGGAVGAASAVTAPVRSGGYALRINPASSIAYITKRQLPMVPDQVHHWRFYLFIASEPTTDVKIFLPRRLNVMTDPQIALSPMSELKLMSTTAQVGSSSGPLQPNTWYLVEIEGVYNTGLCAARLDGVEFATGQCNAVDAEQWRLGAGVDGVVASADLYFDDLGHNDSFGTVQNSWLGPGSIVHLYPNSGAGFEQVDEQPTPNDADDYLVLPQKGSAFDVGCQDLDVVVPATINLVQVGGRITLAAKNNAGNWQPRVTIDGAVRIGNNTTLTQTTWHTHTDQPWQNYLLSYGPTTKAAVNAMTIGAQTTDGNPDTWVTSVWALIEY